VKQVIRGLRWILFGFQIMVLGIFITWAGAQLYWISRLAGSALLIGGGATIFGGLLTSIIALSLGDG
jgi:hypothetical protein